ncbi:MAG: ATP-dependent DNA helicase RecQ [Saprospiraceae bacterium]
MSLALKTLKKYWGFNEFRSLQSDVISSVLNRQDTIALLHTGAGKSLCFQLPAMIFEGKTIVVSPLIALMQDQVAALSNKGIVAKAIYSGIGYRQVDLILDDFVNGPLKILYVSPERLKTDMFIERFKLANVSLIAIDEAHCISQWGHDFRPAYYEIATLRALKPEVPVIAVTATATPNVVKDISDRLGLKSPAVYQSTFERDNLSLSVMFTESKMEALNHVLSKFKGSGIIYLRSRQRVQLLAKELESYGLEVDYYHGGMPIKKRMKVQQDWIENKKKIIVCTNAFGMGVDKSDVRFVIHMDIPPSIEEYYQESGRAGRDGIMSYAVSIIGYSDIVKLQKYHLVGFPKLEYISEIYNRLCSFLKIGYGSGIGETFEVSLESFCTQYRYHMGSVYSVLNILEKEGWLVLTEGFRNPSQLLITSNKRHITMSSRNKDIKSKMLLYMLRKYEGVFIDYVKLDEGRMANDLEIKVDVLIQELNVMHKESILSYKQASSLPRIIFLSDRPAKNSFAIDKQQYLLREKNARKKMESIQNYMTSFDCRQNFILSYFKEDGKPCGRCDICKGSKEILYSETEKNALLNHIKKHCASGTIYSDDYMKLWPFNKKSKVFAIIQELESEQLINIDDIGIIKILDSDRK